MANLTLFLMIVICACVFVNAQHTTFGQKKNEGQTYEEVIVSSDLNVRRKSRANISGKSILTNTHLAKVVSNDGGHDAIQKRNRRSDFTKNRLNLGAAEYLLHSS